MTGEHLPLQTPIQKKKGGSNCFPLKGKNPALEATDKGLKYPRLWAEPKIIHSVLCAKYRMQLPLTQPCSRVDKTVRSNTCIYRTEGPKRHSGANFFFQGQLDDNDFSFYKHIQLTDILECLTLGFFPLFFH